MKDISKGTNFPGTDFPHINFPGTNFPGTNFPGTIFSGIIFRGDRFTGDFFPGDHFTGDFFLGDHFSAYPIKYKKPLICSCTGRFTIFCKISNEFIDYSQFISIFSIFLYVFKNTIFVKKRTRL